jgi:hypothetical protein
VRRAALCVVLLLGSTQIARADEPSDPDDLRARADALVAEGTELGRSGALVPAIAKFKQADALVSRAVHACNIGLAYARLKQWPQAELFLGRCREQWAQEESRPLNPWVDRRIREAINAMRGKGYTPVKVTVTPAHADITVSSLPADESFHSRIVWLPHGDHVLIARADGYQTAQRQIAASGEQQLSVELALKKEQPAAQPEPAPKQDDPPDLTTPPDPATSSAPVGPIEQPAAGPATDRRSSRGPWPYVIGGAGLAAVAAGGVFHVTALSTKSDAEDEPAGSPKFDDLQSDFERQRAIALGLYGVGLVGVGVGVYLWLTGDDGDQRVSVSPRPGGATAVVRWSF